jgi:hypothetical protein
VRGERRGEEGDDAAATAGDGVGGGLAGKGRGEREAVEEGNGGRQGRWARQRERDGVGGLGLGGSYIRDRGGPAALLLCRETMFGPR